MSQVSEQSRGKQTETQSVRSGRSAQSSNVQGRASSVKSEQKPQPQQQQTSSHVERRSVQRSTSSATSSSVGSSSRQAHGRAGGPVGAGGYQQQSGATGYGYGGATGGYQQQSGAAGYPYGGATGGSYSGSGGSFGSGVSGQRRQGQYRRQVIQLPDQPSGQVRQMRYRLPTPEPDTLERVYIQRTAPEVIEEITEIPTTPPPRVQERTVVEPAGPPQVVRRTIRVPPRGAYGGYQQQQQGAGYQLSGSYSGTGSFGNIQQVASSYQQQAPASYQQQTGTAYSGGYSGAATVGGGYQQQQRQPVQHPIVFTVGGDGNSFGPKPSVGCQSAFCFYV